METKDVYQYIFSDQLQKNKKLGKEPYVEPTVMGNYYGEGEIPLFFMETDEGLKEGKINLTLKKLLFPKEIEMFSQLYIFMGFIQSFPRFLHHKHIMDLRDKNKEL